MNLGGKQNIWGGGACGLRGGAQVFFCFSLPPVPPSPQQPLPSLPPSRSIFSRSKKNTNVQRFFLFSLPPVPSLPLYLLSLQKKKNTNGYNILYIRSSNKQHEWMRGKNTFCIKQGRDLLWGWGAQLDFGMGVKSCRKKKTDHHLVHNFFFTMSACSGLKLFSSKFVTITSGTRAVVKSEPATLQSTLR